MKKTIIVITILTCMATFFGCSSSKKVEKTSAIDSGIGTIIPDLPCTDKSNDDANNYRALGVGHNINIQNARTAALQAAKGMINEKLGGFVQGLDSYYAGTKAGTTGEDTKRKYQNVIEKVIEKELNDALQICDKMAREESGAYNSFIVIEIPKGKIIDAMDKALSENEELKIDYESDKFKEYAKNRIEEIKASKKK